MGGEQTCPWQGGLQHAGGVSGSRKRVSEDFYLVLFSQTKCLLSLNVSAVVEVFLHVSKF